MADKKPALEKLTTPKGIAVFPKLVTPDEYKGKTKYSTGIKFLKADVQDLLDKLTAKAQAVFDEKKAELAEKLADAKGAAKAAAKKKIDEMSLHLPFKPDYDEDGNENDYVILKASMNASYVDKKGKTVHIKPSLYDAKAHPIKKAIDVWGGSEIKVSAALLPTYVDSSGACGITLRLQGVQIITLRQGGQSAEQMGFGAEEGGYDSSEGDDDLPKQDGDGSSPEEEEQF